MSSSIQRKIARRPGQKGNAAQIMGLLNTLAPGLQEMEGQLREVANMAPSLQRAQSEWEDLVRELRNEIADLREEQRKTKALLLRLIHSGLEGIVRPGMSLAEFLRWVERLEAEQTPESNE